MSIPLLLVSDSPSAASGLARITRDLAVRIAAHLPEFRVATFGYGHSGSRHLPFPQYHWTFRDDYLMPELPEVWQDFAGDESGIIMTIWDASRLLWLADPDYCRDANLKAWLLKMFKSKKLKTWAYLPIDASGPHNMLTAQLAHVIQGFDRRLCYSQWAAEIVDRTLGVTSTDFLPHGIDTSVFQPRNRSGARHNFGQRIGAQKGNKFFSISDDALAIGIVATNQARKDYGLAIQAVAEVSKSRKVFLWIHTDVLDRHWSIPALLNDYGLLNHSVVTTLDLSDESMSWMYSAMDVTLGIGLGEGWGFPIFESLACGVPCIHGNYGGAAEHMDNMMLVSPEMYRFEGTWNCNRPVHCVDEWARRIKDITMETWDGRILPLALEWENLWPRWAVWLKEGIK